MVTGMQRVVSGIQAKLVVGQHRDKYEQEADRVADEVMRTAEPEEQITPLVQRHVEEEEAFQRSLNEPEPPLPSIALCAAGPPASTTPSPECALMCGSTHQMASPGMRVPPYRADLVRGISGGAIIECADADILPALPETMTV